jgi:DNA-binding transcriptional ArsR family regulator
MTYHRAIQALGVPTRLTILEQLRRRPMPVGELARGLPVSRPAVSQHLKVLKQAGLIRDRRVGNRRIYAIDPAGLAGLRAYVESFWTAALNELKATAEAEGRKAR